jgi:hypothetical protein
MTRFEKGHTGRPKNSRNKLCHALLADLAADWAEGGADAIKIMRIEEPAQYVKVMVSILPKELIWESGLADIDDVELDTLIEMLRARALEVRQQQALELKPEKPRALLNGRH